MILDKKSKLYTYVSDEQKDLLNQGFHLLDHVNEDREIKFDDYSFVVFPFAKAYEGFLKQIFLDTQLITRKDYISKYFRIGRVLSPNMAGKLGNRSVYKKICDLVGCELSDELWQGWKIGRNQVFHYFPHNLRSLTLYEAEAIIHMLLDIMEKAVDKLTVEMVKHKLNTLSRHEAKQIKYETQHS